MYATSNYMHVQGCRSLVAASATISWAINLSSPAEAALAWS